MTTKALVTRRGAAAPEQARATERSAAIGLNMMVEHELPHASLVRGTPEDLQALEAQGFRVKLLPDTNILQIGQHRIDIEAGAARLPKGLVVPPAARAGWIHHLVQFVGPIQPEWVAALEERGADVVEPVGPYGMFVVCSDADAQALKSLDFVAWVGRLEPAWRLHDNLAGLKGDIRYVSIGVYPESEAAAVRAVLTRGGAKEVRASAPNEHGGHYTRLVAQVPAKLLPALAQQPGVRWLEYVQPEPGFDGERESQIVGENFNAAGTAPVPGYQAFLTGVGLSGAGVVVAINDTGVDDNANNNTTGHLDLRGRMAAFVDYTGGTVATDTQGHGTHVAGIAVGNAGSNQFEGAAPDNFQRGLGVAPGANYVVQNGLMLSPWPPADFSPFIRDAVANGARAQNNSWFSSGAGSGYTATARQYDQLVRDPDRGTAGLEQIGIVFSAGNAGGGASTITGPKEAKNVIVVGNALNFRPGAGFPFDGWGVNGSSSRGPALDGRILPNVVAPGTDVLSASVGTDDQHVFMTGTSMASPHVTGTCALLVQWWRARTGGKDPSAAMLKALLINGAEDLGRMGGQNWFARSVPSGAGLKTLAGIGFTPNSVVDQATGMFDVMTPVASAAAVTAPGQWFYNVGTDTLTYRLATSTAFRLYLRDGAGLPPVPNNHQGWGMVSLENMLLQAPFSDRGPRIFSDQRHAFIAAGQEFSLRVAPVDPARPLRITLVWTDAAGGANANPALVNDLDLEVSQGATVWRGNVFANGFSTPGGAFDNRNNIECVYIQNPVGVYDVSVIAATIAQSARPDIATPWQDFALVVENAEVPAAAPVGVVPVIDRSGSMIYYGYEATTRATSKQFVDLLGVDDQLGLVSFGDSGVVEFPSAAPLVPQAIVGQATRDAAKSEVDGIAFGGCTYMGDGIVKARDLLAGGTTAAKSIVLFSDGYDNKGCDAANPAKPSALAAVGTLPAGLRLYSCAMGASADQMLLEQLASATGGRYYFMPTIDDLFEIYNYIRGQVTGDSVVANESAQASASRVGAFVDAQASEATFTVAWGSPALKFAPVQALKPGQICVRLRDPGGRLLHPHDSAVRCNVGEGYVIFELRDPAPGQWFMEVSTALETHTRYTAAGFVRSPVRIQVAQTPRLVVPGGTLAVALRAWDGKLPLAGMRAAARLSAPVAGVPTLLKKYKSQLADIRPPRLPKGDVLPKPIAQLAVLRKRLMQAGKPDLFARSYAELKMIRASPPVLVGAGLPASLAVAGTLLGKTTATAESGSYNLVVQASGMASGGRFVRKELISVLVT